MSQELTRTRSATMASKEEGSSDPKERGAMDRFKRYISVYGVPAFVYIAITTLSLFYSMLALLRLAVTYYYYFRDPSPDKRPPWKVKKRPVPPKCLDDSDYGTHTYIQLEKIKLHYVEHGDKEKPLMIFLHGFPEFWFSWRHQIKEFSKDYWTVALDLRGCGDSEKPPGIRYYKFKYLVEDLKNLVQALGRKKCILVAHDWGGMIAWIFIDKYPEFVDKFVVINAPHPKLFRRLLTTSFSQFRKSWYMFFYQMPFLPEFLLRQKDMKIFHRIFKNGSKPFVSDDELEAYKFMYGKPGGFTCPVNYYRANLFSNSRFMKYKTDPTVKRPPGLFVFGEADIAIDNLAVDLVRIKMPDIKVDAIAGGSHFIHEEEHERVNGSIREFLTAN